MSDDSEDSPRMMTIEFINGPLGKGTLTIPLPVALSIPDAIEVTFERNDTWRDENGKLVVMLRDPVVARYEFDKTQDEATAENRFRVVRRASD